LDTTVKQALSGPLIKLNTAKRENIVLQVHSKLLLAFLDSTSPILSRANASLAPQVINALTQQLLPLPLLARNVVRDTTVSHQPLQLLEQNAPRVLSMLTKALTI
jgi:hypothetical protein